MRILNVRRLAMLTAALNFTSIALADRTREVRQRLLSRWIAPTTARPRAGRNCEGTTRHAD